MKMLLMRIVGTALLVLLMLLLSASSTQAFTGSACGSQSACNMTSDCAVGVCYAGSCQIPTYVGSGMPCNNQNVVCKSGLACIGEQAPSSTYPTGFNSTCQQVGLLTPCTSSSYCTCVDKGNGDSFCDWHRPAGDICDANSECLSNQCVWGRCNGIGNLQTCSWDTSSATSQTQHNPCMPGYYCRGNGTVINNIAYGNCEQQTSTGQACEYVASANRVAPLQLIDLCEGGSACNLISDSATRGVCAVLYSLSEGAACYPGFDGSDGYNPQVDFCQLGLYCDSSSHTCVSGTNPTGCNQNTPCTQVGYGCSSCSSSSMDGVCITTMKSSECQAAMTDLTTCLRLSKCPSSVAFIDPVRYSTYGYMFTQNDTCLSRCMNQYYQYTCCIQSQHSSMNERNPPHFGVCPDCKFECFHRGNCDFMTNYQCQCDYGYTGGDCGDSLATLAIVYTAFLLLLVVGSVVMGYRVVKAL